LGWQEFLYIRIEVNQRRKNIPQGLNIEAFSSLIAKRAFFDLAITLDLS
jgi:hypothetical protein